MKPSARKNAIDKLFTALVLTSLLLSAFSLGKSPSVQAQEAVTNDDFDSATPISQTPFTDNLNISAATWASDDPAIPECNLDGPHSSVWYSFNPAAAGHVHIDTQASSFDTVLAIWSGTRGNLTLIGCNDDKDDSLQAALDAELAGGNTFFIQVGRFYNYLAAPADPQAPQKTPPALGRDTISHSDDLLNLQVTFLAEPINDQIETATAINELPFTDSLDTTAATLAASDRSQGDCDLAPGLASVWYAYTPGVDTIASLDTLDSDYDTYIAIWTEADGALSPVACNDDADYAGDVYQSQLELKFTAATPYYIEIAEWNGYLDPSAPDIFAKELPAGAGIGGGRLNFQIKLLDEMQPDLRPWPRTPGETRAVQDQNGRWLMPQGATTRAEEAKRPVGEVGALATGGPDDFGYTWDDSLAYSWIDTSGGTNTGIPNYSYNAHSGPISLPFGFKYYENTYTQLYVSSNGYVTFTSPTNWDDQSDLPDPNEPNNVIAPYWMPSYTQTGAWVKYLSGGTAPNRYFVIEWHNLQDTSVSDSSYTYETILYENGNIDFQYASMGWGVYCAGAGIEDFAGLDGLDYLQFCHETAPSYTNVRFTRPAPAFRVAMSPLFDGRFTSAAQTVDFPLTLHNNGDLGADTYKLTVSSVWPVNLYAGDGTTLLADTDADGVLDTGSLAQGVQLDLIARVQTPALAAVGDSNDLLLTATSTQNPSYSRTARLQTSVPAPFAQVYVDTFDGAMSLDLVRPGVQTHVIASPAGQSGYDPAVASAPGRNLVYSWETYRRVGNHSVEEIYYALLGRNGSVVRPASRLADLGSTAYFTFDEYPALATAPNGNTGVVWTRTTHNSNGKHNCNVFFALIDPAGRIISGPTNLTGNTVYGNWSDMYVSEFLHAQIAATGDNRFVLAWQKEYLQGGGYSDYVDDIYYAVRSSSGAEIHAPRQETYDTPGWDGYKDPVLAQLSSNRTILSWHNREVIYYEVIGSDGNTLAGNAIGPGSFVDNNSDAAQLADGNILLLWQDYRCYPEEDVPHWRYILMDGSYDAIGTFQCLPKAPGAQEGEIEASVTAVGAHGAALTWVDGGGNYIYYALLDNSGTVLTAPAIVRRSQTASSSIETSSIGYGNAPYADTITISGNAGVGGATLSYIDGTPKSVVADSEGNYSFSVVYWSGTVTPSKPGYAFTPSNRTYTDFLNDQSGQDYSAVYVGAAPSVPALLSPANNALTTDYTPTLDWAIVTIPSGTTFGLYQVQVADNAGFDSPMVDDSTITNIVAHQYTVPDLNTLNPNTTYYWRVRSEITAGKYSAWSAARTFRTALLPPTLSSPADAAPLLNKRPTFDWEDVDKATGYTLQVSKNSTFTSLVGTYQTTLSTYTPVTDLPANSNLWWRVQTKGTNGPSAWSPVRWLHTANPPSIPSLLSPASNMLSSAATAILTWKPSTPVLPNSIDHYRIQVDTNSNSFASPEVDQELGGTSYSLVLNPGDIYYWRVCVYDNAGQFSSWSATWSLRAKMLAPTLVSPIGGVVVGNPVTFDWSDINGASNYTLQASISPSFSSFLLNTTVVGSSYSMSSVLPLGKTIYWRVQGKGTTGPSNWSTVGTFSLNQYVGKSGEGTEDRL